MLARQEVEGRHLVPACDDRRREIELPIQLESPSLHREGARGRAGLRGPVDDAYGDTLAGEPQCQHPSRGGSTSDEDFGTVQMGAEQLTLTVRYCCPGLTVMSRRTSR